MLLEKRTTLLQRILRQIRIETHQSESRVIDQSQRRKTDQSGDCNKARCKRIVVAVGNCTRAMCVRARRSQCSSTESARSPPQPLYIPGQFIAKAIPFGSLLVVFECFLPGCWRHQLVNLTSPFNGRFLGVFE